MNKPKNSKPIKITSSKNLDNKKQKGTMESHKGMEGMSTAEDLIKVWNKFKSANEPDLIVDWNFHNPELSLHQTKDHPHGVVYIMNIRSLYNNQVPGHWVALIRIYNDKPSEYGKIYYYNPFGTILPKIAVEKLDCRYIYESVHKEQNFTGENSESCGYYCIMFLLAFLRRFKSYEYIVFDKKFIKANNPDGKNYGQRGRFIDTQPNNVKFKINIDAMEKEISSNEALLNVKNNK